MGLLKSWTILATWVMQLRTRLWWAGHLDGVKLKDQGSDTLVTATALAWPHNSTSCCRPKR